MALGETRRAPAATPKGLADRWEHTVSVLAKELHARRAQIRQTVGARPYRGVPVDDAELLQRYSQVRRDPSALLDILKKNVTFTAEGAVRVPKALIEKMTKMETTLRKGDF